MVGPVEAVVQALTQELKAEREVGDLLVGDLRAQEHLCVWNPHWNVIVNRRNGSGCPRAHRVILVEVDDSNLVGPKILSFSHQFLSLALVHFVS